MFLRRNKRLEFISDILIVPREYAGVIIIKTVRKCPPPPLLTSKLDVEVLRNGNEFSLDMGNDNWKLEIETQKSGAKIDLNFHMKSSCLQSEATEFQLGILFCFLNGA